MTDRELMQQALDALKVMRPACFAETTLKAADAAITALRDRLAQTKQGPAAWEQFNEHMAGPFYKAPRELTDVEIHQQTIDALRGKVEKLKPKHPWIGLTDEPIAWMFQHEETGRTMCVDVQQLESGFEDGNPRLKKIAPLYTNPRRQWVGLTDEDKAGFWTADQMTIEEWDTLFNEIEAALKEKNT